MGPPELLGLPSVPVEHAWLLVRGAEARLLSSVAIVSSDLAALLMADPVGQVCVAIPLVLQRDKATQHSKITGIRYECSGSRFVSLASLSTQDLLTLEHATGSVPPGRAKVACLEQSASSHRVLVRLKPPLSSFSMMACALLCVREEVTVW